MYVAMGRQKERSGVIEIEDAELDGLDEGEIEERIKKEYLEDFVFNNVDMRYDRVN